MCGNVFMEGGYGYFVVFGFIIENFGIEGVVGVGLFVVIIGFIMGGILGCFVVKFLINKYKLKLLLNIDLLIFRYNRNLKRFGSKFFRNKNRIKNNNFFEIIILFVFLE